MDIVCHIFEFKLHLTQCLEMFWFRCDLNTIMRGLLSPNDMKEAMDRASTKKVFVARHILCDIFPQAEDFKYLQAKSDFLGSMMGRGVILLSLSMIKYSWYIVMKTNFENARPAISSRALASSQAGEEEGDKGEEEEAPGEETAVGGDP